MDWSTLLPTLLGGLLATGGGFLAQLRSERHAIARESREHEQERFVWARERRYEAHLAFLRTHDELARAADRLMRQWQFMEQWDVPPARDHEEHPGYEDDDFSPTPDDPHEFPDDYLQPLAERLETVTLLSDPATAGKAEAAYQALFEHVFRPSDPNAWKTIHAAIGEYRAAIRVEFKLAGPGAG